MGSVHQREVEDTNTATPSHNLTSSCWPPLSGRMFGIFGKGRTHDDQLSRYLQSPSIRSHETDDTVPTVDSSEPSYSRLTLHSLCQTRVSIGMPTRWHAGLIQFDLNFDYISSSRRILVSTRLPRPSKILPRPTASGPFPTQANRCSLSGLEPFLELTWRARHSPVLHMVTPYVYSTYRWTHTTRRMPACLPVSRQLFAHESSGDDGNVYSIRRRHVSQPK